jgi:hypothetical protein
MPGSTLRRFFVLGLVLGLCMLPLASAQASPRNGGRESGQKAMILVQIQDLGRSFRQLVEQALGLSGPAPAATTNTFDPFGSDGRGIDPNGVPRP